MAFRYRLQRLLEQKIAARDEARQVLADHRKQAAAERQALQMCHEERDRVAGKLAELRGAMLGGAGANGGLIGMRREYALSLAEDLRTAQDALRAQELRVTDADDAVEQARRALAEASRAVDTLEKHRERLALEFAREAERKEALEQEEMGNLTYLRRRQQS